MCSVPCWEMHVMGAKKICVILTVKMGFNEAFMLYFWSHFAPKTYQIWKKTRKS